MIGRSYEFGAKLEYATLFRVGLDDLYALSGDLHLPVIRHRGRQVFVQRLEAMMLGLQQLAYQILREGEVTPWNRQRGFHVPYLYRLEKSEQRAMLQEFAGESGVRPEQQ